MENPPLGNKTRPARTCHTLGACTVFPAMGRTGDFMKQAAVLIAVAELSLQDPPPVATETMSESKMGE